jgi:hypothetical protein
LYTLEGILSKRGNGIVYAGLRKTGVLTVAVTFNFL